MIPFNRHFILQKIKSISNRNFSIKYVLGFVGDIVIVYNFILIF